jgi:hypothetical protein
MTYSKLASVAVLLLTALATVSSATPCQCKFDMSNETACRVYGLSTNSSLMPWNPVPTECTNWTNYTVLGLEEDDIWYICPYQNATDVNTDGLLVYMMDNKQPNVNATRLLYPEFFEGDNASASLKDSIITDDGIFINCTLQASRCWNRVKVFAVQQTARTSAICRDWHEERYRVILAQQANARVELCNANNASDVCEPVMLQILEAKSTGMTCASMGRQANESDWPDTATCEANLPEDASGGAGKTSSARGVFSLSMGMTMLVSLVAAILL